MFHIVHLICSSFFGGPERQILGLSSSLSSEHRNSLIVFSELGKCRNLQREAWQRGIDCHIVSDDFSGTLQLTNELERILAGIDADILCCHGYKANLIGSIAANTMDLPFLVVLRGWTGENSKVRFYEYADKIMLGKKNIVVCLAASQVREVLRTGVPENKIRLIPNAICLQRFPLQRPNTVGLPRSSLFQQSKINCCAAGRLSPEKGFINLIYVAKKMKRKNFPINFIIFGEGPLRTVLQQAIDREELSDCVTLAGFSSEFDKLLPCCDILAIPSYTEGISNVLLEAFAAGVAVVASNVGGIPDLIEDGHNGFLVQPGDVCTMSERIEQLATDNRLRFVFSKAGRTFVENKCSFNQQAKQYKLVFRELLDLSPSKPILDYSSSL